MHGGLFQQGEGLKQADQETGAALIDVQAEHVLFQAEPPLDHAAGGRHEVVRRLGDDDQGVAIVAAELARVEQVLHAETGEIGSADGAIDNAVLIVAHHLFELEGASRREIEIGHLVDEAAFVGGDHSQQTADSAVAEYEVHGLPYFCSSFWMEATF